MRATMMWPRCDEFSDSVTCEYKDLYWVECPVKDAEKKIFPHMKQSIVLEAMRTIREETSDMAVMDRYGNRTHCLYFLISKDLSIIKPMLWFYPCSHDICGTQPLREIEEVKINELAELAFIKPVFT